MNVLIVDDIAENLSLLEAMLEGGGYGVVSARNGKEALERLKEGSFDLIVSDILMPVMDGFQLCRACRTHPDWAMIPFVIYTATYTEKKDEEFALALGADRFIVKPQEPETLLKIIREVVDLSRDGAEAVVKGPSLDETAYLTEYGKRIVRKLEKKVADLARINLALRESEKKCRLLADNVEDVIFVLDMNLDYVYISPSVKMLRGYSPEEVIGQPASKTLTPAFRDLAMKTLAARMALEETGQGDPHHSELLELEVRRKDGTTVWTEMRLSLIHDKEGRPAGILGVIRDISERKRAEEVLAESHARLRAALGAVIKTLVVTLEARDPYTAGHQKRVADLARAIGAEMGLEGERLEGLWMAGTIHDIGKISVPAEILSKPSRLSPVELSLVREHSRAGREILKDVEFPWPIAETIHQHHERLDGSGYPLGLKGNEINLKARILAVADTVEAIASHRPYRPALGMEAACAEIEKNAGVLYDGDAAEVCLRLIRERGYRFE